MMAMASKHLRSNNNLASSGSSFAFAFPLTPGCFTGKGLTWVKSCIVACKQGETLCSSESVCTGRVKTNALANEDNRV